MAVPQELREIVEKIDYQPDGDGDVGAHALQAGLLLALVDALEKQTEALNRLADKQS
jgi:hypothetical protein